jgi:16S rRNA (guanine966-N2)-methyltransferase
MRIIAGALKGAQLVTPRGHRTRPTADQVRIALMDTLMPSLPGARFLDLFAGAGSVGLEALSRGARRAVFVERDADAATALRRNVAALHVADQTLVLPIDAARALTRLAAAGERFDVVFLDPPYGAGLVEDTLLRLGGGEVITLDAIVVAQHFTKHAPPERIGALAAYRSRRFGETTLTFFRPGAYDAEAYFRGVPGVSRGATSVGGGWGARG